MKTRQQRLAEERAGNLPSPPQSLPMNQRGPRRARSKTPSATVAAGSVVPAAQSAALGEPQALLRIWIDVGPELSGRAVHDPTHQVAFDSSLFPEVVGFLKNICEASNKNFTSHLEVPEQEMGEAIEPREPEPVIAVKPTKRRKNAFRRNPLMGISAGLMSQPVSAFVDTSAADSIPMIFRHDFNFAANTPGDKISVQPDEKSSSNEDSHMVDASESRSTIGPSGEVSHQVDTQERNLAPETPRGSKWGLTGLLQSARSFTRRLGFSPLAAVAEIPEASPQMMSTRVPQAVTEPTAPTQPKKKRPAPSSARERRAKRNRQNGSAVKSGSTSRRNEQPRAKRANQASSEHDAIEAEDEGFPAMKSTHPEYHKEEARKADIGDPTARPTIRWPSRSLDRMNANKRKRCGDSLDTPGTEAGSHSQGATDSDGGTEEGGITEEQPAKRRRTTEAGGLTGQVAGHPNAARPSSVEWQSRDIFTEDRAARKVTSKGQPSIPKTPIPITNRTGSFKVPSPGDSDWSDSGSDEDEVDNAGLKEISPSRTSSGGIGFEGPRKPHQMLRPAESEALRKAREKYQKHKPRKPSRLSHSIKAFPSPSPTTERQPGPSGRTRFSAFEDWCKTAPPAVTAAIEKMEVDSIMAGNAVEAALQNRGLGHTNNHTAYGEWRRTAPPAVTAVLEQMEVDPNTAGQAFMSGLDKFTKQK